MIDATTSLAELVLEHPGFAPVFVRYGLDFCCKGERSLARAAREAGAELAELLRELELELERAGDPADSDRPDPRGRSTASLVGFLVVRYHDPLRETLPFVAELASKVARVHGAREPSLRQLNDTVQRVVAQLTEHLDMEERTLFPALMRGAPLDDGALRMLSEMEREHREIGRDLESLRSLSSGYVPSPAACGSYRTLFSKLEELELELLQHVHLENHVLAPRFLDARAASIQPPSDLADDHALGEQVAVPESL